MNDNEEYIPFSQRNGFAAIPPQLKIGEVSPELRRLVDYSIRKEVESVERLGFDSTVFSGQWKEVATDFHVKFQKQSASTFENSSFKFKKLIEFGTEKFPIGQLFDLIEFFIRHPNCTNKLKNELAEVFKISRSAYRIIDGQILAVGTQEQAKAFEEAISATELVGASAARRHLVEAGAALREGNWADSVRESIHAVEAMAMRINPLAKTLGESLKNIERSGYIHGSLKSAFEKLYGYTNDERGIRHALSDAESRVDEVDALFMLGACSSFVSYLIAREAYHSGAQSE